MNDDQAQVADALAERAARKREQLGLGEKPAALAEAIAVETVEVVCETAGCGNRILAQRLWNEATKAHVLLPRICAGCREKVAAERSTESRREQQAEQLRAQGRNLRARMAQLDPPPLYQGVTLGSFQHHGDEAAKALQMRVLTWARRYLAEWPAVPSLTCFQGSFGPGKGHIAWALARALVEEQEATARVVKVAALVRQLRDTWRKDAARSYEQVLREYTTVDFLVVDEVSRHAFYGEQIHQHLYDVLDTRIEHQRPTIITTNEEPAGLVEILRPALANRLQGEGGLIRFGDASWRTRRAVQG
jgi:DNA replication protein DnaC